MATILKTISITADPAAIWDAARDVGALHTRLVPGFVTHTELLPGEGVLVRRVTFASGVVLDEVVVDVNDAERRLVWSILADGVRHHNGALQVRDAAAGAAVVEWRADVLPHALADRFGPLMEQGLACMKRTLEGLG